MRSRMLFALVFVASSFTLPLVAYAGIPFFGPIIDQSWNVSSTGVQCALGWGAVITVINNLISLLITLAIVFVAPLMIAWSGFLFVVNSVNASGKEQAKKILTNTIVGIVIALTGWLIVDAIMVVLYNGEFGTWSSLITSNNALTCLPQQGIGTGLNQSRNGVTTPGIGVVPVVPTVTVNINSGVIVSAGAVNILKDILRAASLTSATITSGRRTSDDQTRIMYGNLQSYGVVNQKALYGPNGDAVIDVYAERKQAGASEAVIKAAMKQKIEQLGCSNVSNHCSTNDVFDVAPSSISNGTAFRTAVQNSSAVKKYIFPPTDPAYHIEL